MQSERFLLTFAIPTYNRSSYLAQLLSVLLQQLKGVTQVELIVCDNASSDDTREVVQEFQRRGLHATYIRNETNIGPDANFLNCFQRARGKYVWIFGDDDTLVPGAINRIIELLEHQDFDLVYITPYGYTRPEQLECIPKITREPAVYTSAASYSRRINIMFTLISANIINKDRLSKTTTPDFASYIGTNVIQLGWTYAALNNFGSALFVPQVTVISLSENSGGYGLCRVMGVNMSMIATEILTSPRIVRILENSTLRDYFPSYLLKMKEATYTLNREPAHEILSARFRSNPNYWLFLYPIIKLPTFFARGWLLICRILAKSHRILFIVVAEKFARKTGAVRDVRS